MSDCVFAYGGKCQHSNYYGTINKFRCADCKGYSNIKDLHNRQILQMLFDQKARIDEEIEWRMKIDAVKRIPACI